jgi:hypothetical protein
MGSRIAENSKNNNGLRDRMEFEDRGAGRRGKEPTPSQAGRQEQTQAPQQRGEGIRGVPPPQGEQKPQSGSINKPELEDKDKLWRRARRLDHRKEFQTVPPYIPAEKTALEEAEDIVAGKQWRERMKSEEQALANLTPEELEHHHIEEAFDDLKRSRTMSLRISRAQHFNVELINKMQQHDPEFMDPIITGIEKRPARQAKAERAIQRRHINSGVDE